MQMFHPQTSARPIAPPDAGDRQDEDIIDLAALFATLWRGKHWIVLITAVAALIGAYYANVVATPLYRSTAVVILETDKQQVLDLQSVVGGLSGDTSEVNSEVEVLRARSLMEKVVDRLDLVNDPEFNSDLRNPRGIQGLKTTVKGLVGLSPDQTALPNDERRQRTQDAVVSNLLRATTVRNVPLSLVFQVTVETQDPRKSALIADTIVELYILNQIEVKFEATEQATVWLSDRVAELQVTLETAEAAVSAFSGSTDLVSVEGLQALERQIKDLRDRIDQASESRMTLAAQIEALETAETRTDRAAVANDQQLTSFLSRSQTDATYLEAFDTRYDLVLSRLRGDLIRSDQQLTALRASEADLAQDLDRQGADLIRLQQLTREAEATRVLYQYFLTRFNETSAQQGLQQADSRILSDAVVPTQPSAPRTSLIVAMAGMLGLMSSIGWILLQEARRKGFRTAQDLERATGHPVLGQIPKISGRTRLKSIQGLQDNPTSAAAEAYRNLRTSLMMSHGDRPPKVILMTSSLPDEGKTTNAIALAQNIAALDKTVLLVEGDMRRRSVHATFPDLPDHGFEDIITGARSFEDCVVRNTNITADILPSGRLITNAADLFSSDGFAQLMARARDAYDVIVVDTPPVLAVPDTLILAEHADSILFTVRWDRTSKPQLEESVRLFRNSGLSITGLILSQINPKGMRRYGYAGCRGPYVAYGMDY